LFLLPEIAAAGSLALYPSPVDDIEIARTVPAFLTAFQIPFSAEGRRPTVIPFLVSNILDIILATLLQPFLLGSATVWQMTGAFALKATLFTHLTPSFTVACFAH
jgi:hypothetical protein